MHEIPVTSPPTKLPWDKGMYKHEEISDPIDRIHGHLDKHLAFLKNSPRPTNSITPTTATKRHYISEQKHEMADPLHREHVPFKPESLLNADDLTDSDLTEIDEVIPPVASGQSPVVDSHNEDSQHNVPNNIHDIAKDIEHSCSLPINPPAHQECRDTADLDTGVASSRELPSSSHPLSLLSPPAKTNARVLETQLDQTKKRGVSQKTLNVERRTSSRPKTATAKLLSMANYFDDDSDDNDNHRKHPVRRHSSTASGSGRAANVLPKLETPEQDVQQPDSWKAGWQKIDKVFDEVPAATSTSTTTSSSKSHSEGRAVRKSSRTHRNHHTSQHKQPLARVKPPRVSCPKNCGMTFGRFTDARRHAEQTSGCGASQKVFKCHSCGKGFSRNDALRRHLGLGEGTKRHLRCSGLLAT